MTATPPSPDEPTPAPDYRDQYETLTGVSLRACPACHDGQLRVIEAFASAPAPLDSS